MSDLRTGEPFVVAVTFHSDWICGTGTGRYGAVDREIQRDRDGLPMVRGKALAAMLRDAAETVARGLDEDNSGLWHDWVRCVFGSQPAVERTAARGAPTPSSLTCPPLHLAEPLRTRIIDDSERALLTEATVLPRAGVKIDRDSGVAVDDMLRIEERARAGLSVAAYWTLTVPGAAAGEPVPFEAELLLRAAASMTTALGGKRRRGAGRCTVHIGADDDGTRLPELLDRIDTAGGPSDPAAAHTPAAPLGARAATPLRHRYTMRLTTRTPLAINRAVRGNVMLTERFVPGTVLLRLLAPALGEAATSAITGARVAVTDAFLEIDGHRSVPTPLCFTREPGGSTVHNGLCGDRPEGKTQRPAPFCSPATPTCFAEPRIVEQGHGVIDDAQQRPNENSGGLFVNQALDAGTVLRAEIWSHEDVRIDRDRLEGNRSLGRSRKDDYGHVTVELRDPEPADVGEPPADEETLDVWLQSDVILRDDNGALDPSVSRLLAVLGVRLGVELAEPRLPQVGVRRWESWHTRWNLPRPSLVALRAGSVVRCTVHGTITGAAWARVHSDGIGERTPEGFGRLALNAPLLRAARIEPESSDVDTRDAVTGVPSITDPAMTGEQIARHAWRARLGAVVITAAADDDRRARLIPSGAGPAQLGTVRTLADRLARDDDLEPLRAWVQEKSGSRQRAGQWRDTRDTLRSFLESPDELWNWLFPPTDEEPVVVPADIRSGLWRETLAAALAEAARIAVRRNRDTAGEEQR